MRSNSRRNHDEHHDGEEALEEPDRELQLDLLGQQVQTQHDAEADEREPRPGAPQPHEQGPQQERDDDDIGQVAKRELRKGVHQRNPPGGISWAALLGSAPGPASPGRAMPSATAEPPR
jgi:hypothetical protein